jgi:hypothetical protein
MYFTTSEPFFLPDTPQALLKMKLFKENPAAFG